MNASDGTVLARVFDTRDPGPRFVAAAHLRDNLATSPLDNPLVELPTAAGFLDWSMLYADATALDISLSIPDAPAVSSAYWLDQRPLLQDLVPGVFDVGGVQVLGDLDAFTPVQDGNSDGLSDLAPSGRRLAVARSTPFTDALHRTNADVCSVKVRDQAVAFAISTIDDSLLSGVGGPDTPCVSLQTAYGVSRSGGIIENDAGALYGVMQVESYTLFGPNRMGAGGYLYFITRKLRFHYPA